MKIPVTAALLLSPVLVGAAAFAPSPFSLRTRNDAPPASAVAAPGTTTPVRVGSSSASSSEFSVPERVLLVGPSLLQLVVSKHLKAKGIDSLIVCPTAKVDQFKSFVKNGLDPEADAEGEDVMSRALFGLPEESDPAGFGWREGVTAVIVCAEEAMMTNSVIDTVMTWDGYGSDRDSSVDGPDRAILCIPISSKVNKERSMGWLPVFNNDKNEEKVWGELISGWAENEYVSGSRGDCTASVVRFGSLFGGSVDGPPELRPLGLNEKVYKMSMEQYRDLRERSFDRFRLGAQILAGDATNRKPSSQAAREKNIRGQEKEAFIISGGYPEEDRTNRHTLAAALAQAVYRPVRGQFVVDGGSGGSVPEEFTVLSRAVGSLQTDEEWDELFKSPAEAPWPDPAEFVMPEQPVEL